jgi:hypothetical protein
MQTLENFKLLVQKSKYRFRALWPEPSVSVDRCLHSDHLFRFPSSDVSNKRTFDPCDWSDKKKEVFLSSVDRSCREAIT